MIDRLFVLWSDPERGRRHVVGHLQRRDSAFCFWYGEELAAAEAKGFSRLPAFPDPRGEHEPYVARYLFAAFAERIPSRARSDGPEMLRAWGVTNADDQFEILARSGGVRATDRLELAEYRALDDDLACPLEFRLAGVKYTGGATLRAGEPLTFERESDNEADAGATLIVTRTNERAGYVPRQYSALIARLLDNGDRLAAESVRQLALPDDAGRWVIRAHRT